VISQPPLRVAVRSPFGLKVAVEDRFGNVVTTYAGSVAVARASGPGNSILGGTLKIVVDQGVATFSKLMLNQIGVGYSLKATSNVGLQSAKTVIFNVVVKINGTAGHAARLVRTAIGAKLHNAQRMIKLGT
jgi:hypothetical protein